jgi:hypothetical protein
MRKIGDHAVVLGASMSGLLLADAYHRVAVIDRDPLPDFAADRQGVPRGRHAHALPQGGPPCQVRTGLIREYALDPP